MAITRTGGVSSSSTILVPYLDIKSPQLSWTSGAPFANMEYRKTSNISRTLVGNKIVDNSDVVGASPVGAAPTTSSFST